MKKMIALIALLAIFPAMSTDMYLAAIPIMERQWNEPLPVVNLTLVLFYVAYCFCLLLYGPLSDRYGRRPPLIAGLVLYTLSSFLCAGANGVTMLIIGRTLQGAGAAAASAIVFAISKDLFEGAMRQRVFVQLGVIVSGAPMIAPVMGGWIISAWSWRWVFVALALLGLIGLAGVWKMEESARNRDGQSMGQAFKGYLRLTANRPYLLLTLAFASTGLPFFAFIASSAQIYISQLGYSEHQYGYFFGANASAFMVAPLTFSRMAKKFSLRYLLPVSYFGIFFCSLLMTADLLPAPYRMCVPMWLVTFFFAFGRPPGNNLILEQVDRDAGAASSLMVFVFFMTGSLTMWLVSFDWADKITIIGWLGVIAAAMTLAGWQLASRRFGLKM